MCRFKIDKMTCSKLQSRTAYGISKNKPLIIFNWGTQFGCKNQYHGLRFCRYITGLIILQSLSILPVAQTTCQKHLYLYLDEKLNFSFLIKEKISKAFKGIDIKMLHYVLPRNSLLTIYKLFIRSHLAKSKKFGY